MAEEKMITTRNLIDTEVGPLRKITGILDSMPTEKRSYDQADGSKRESTSVVLNLKELEVLEAVEPYHFPIYTTRPFALSNRKKSRWGVLGESFNEIADMQYTEEQLDPTNPAYVKPSGRMDISDCIGKRIGLVMADGQDGRPISPLLFDGRATDDAHPKGQDVATPTWKFFMIEDIGVAGGQGVSPLDKAIELLNGKTLADFNAAALADPIIRGDTQLLTSIALPPSAPNSFSSAMLATKKFKKDKNGVFSKV